MLGALGAVAFLLGAQASPPDPLHAGARVERSLAGGDRHIYALDLGEGQVFEAKVTSPDLFVSLSLRADSGDEAREADGALRLVTAGAGRFLLTVAPKRADAPSGRYTLEVAPSRPAEPADLRRDQADGAMREGRRLLRESARASTERARDDFIEAERLYAEAGDLPGQFDARSMIGEAFDLLDDQEGARTRYVEARALAERAGDPRLSARALGWIGLAEAHLGRADSARENLLSATNTLRELGDTPGLAGALVSLSFALSQRSDREGAIVALEEAVPLLLDVGDEENLATAYNNLAYHYTSYGDAERALDYNLRALALRRRLGLPARVRASLTNIATLYTNVLGRPEDAVPLLDQALTIATETGERLGMGWTQKAYGEALGALGRHAEAAARMEEARANFRDVRAPRPEGSALVSLGNERLALGEPSVAEAAFREARELCARASAPACEAAANLGLARVAGRRDDFPRARALAEQAVEFVEQARTKVGDDELRAAYFSTVLPTYEFYVDLLMRQGDVPGAFRASERGRARTLLEAVQTTALDTGTERPAEAAGFDSALLGLDEVRPLLGTDRVLVEYALGAERSYAWVVTEAGARGVELAARGRIEAAARRVVTTVQARNENDSGPARRARLLAADRAFVEAARDLAALTLVPLALPAGSKLAIVPDGALHYVPFAALPEGASARPLAMGREIVVLPSASVLATLRGNARRRPRSIEDPVAVVADPVFRADDGRVRVARAGPSPRPLPYERLLLRSAAATGLGDLPRLAFSRIEAESIASLLPKGRIRLLLDFAADRQAVLGGDVSGARVVHFATHGLLNSRQPALSGLALSMIDAQGRPKDGFLRLGDVHGLRLSADLVVLSACQTALGKEIRGEGIMGLTRGFMVAGAPRVLASLWRIQDVATAELMRRFYEASLRRGLAPAAALREAQIAMSRDPRWRAPYYWASFALHGDWD